LTVQYLNVYNTLFDKIKEFIFFNTLWEIKAFFYQIAISTSGLIKNLMSNKILKFESFKGEQWNKFLDQMNGTLHFHSSEFLEYYTKFDNVKNISFVIMEGTRCLSMVALGIDTVKKEFSFGSHFCPEPLINQKINNYQRRKLLQFIRSQIIQLAKKYKVSIYKLFSHPILYEKNMPIISSENQFYQLKWAREFYVHNTIIIDLKTTLESIWENFSKYHKKNIKSIDKKKITFDTIDYKTKKEILNLAFLDFKQAHFLSAGKKTRPDDTWDIMKKMIVENKALLFTLSFEGKNISFLYCGLYNKFAYGWSQVNIDTFKIFMPRHLIEWEAIKKLKKMNCKFYEVGERYFSYDSFKPSEKEISISEFKEKLGGKFYPKVFYTSNLDF
jgi:hypothetical protein